MKSLGIDLGGTRIKFGIVEQGRLLEQTSCDTRVQDGYEGVVRQIAGKSQELFRMYPDIDHAGLGCPGLIDTENGKVFYSNNFGWEAAPICRDLEESMGMEVRIANDAACAALGEARYGAGQNYKSMAMLTIGTGVGGGFIRNGRLETEGYGSMSGIFGHMIVSYNGKACNCGGRGCLEAYASAGAIERKGAVVYGRHISAREIFESARNGDQIAGSIVEEFLDYLSVGAVSLANILRPQVIVIGGGVSASCDMILPILNEELKKGVYGYSYAPVYAVCAELGNCAGIMGAADL